MEWGRRPVRPAEREALDSRGHLPSVQLSQNLDDLAVIKRWLGYDAALWRWPPPAGAQVYR